VCVCVCVCVFLHFVVIYRLQERFNSNRSIFWKRQRLSIQSSEPAKRKQIRARGHAKAKISVSCPKNFSTDFHYSLLIHPVIAQVLTTHKTTLLSPIRSRVQYIKLNCGNIIHVCYMS
jgi:hypothetical protein